MTYTFWHSGALIGESDLDETSGHPGQRGGVFRPTPYGLEIFPRLTGILSAGHALKTHLEENGLTPEDMERGAVDELFESTPAGQKIIDIGRMLSDVEVRSADGRRLEFASIAFTDLAELAEVARKLDVSVSRAVTEPPPGAPRYIVSATFIDGLPKSKRTHRVDPYRWRDWSKHN